MVEPADAAQRDELPLARSLNGLGNRRVLLEPEVRAVLVEVVDVRTNDSSKLVVVDSNHMFEAVPPQSAYPPFGVGGSAKASEMRSSHFFDSPN